MDKAKDEVINKLIAGQEKMGKEIAEIRVDITELKQGQKKLESDVTVLKEDISELKQGQKKLEADFSGLKAGFAELKEGQKQTINLLLKVLDNIARLERIIVGNVENDLRTKVDTLSDADKVRQYETTDLKQICRENEEKLENHEIRISRLEKN